MGNFSVAAIIIIAAALPTVNNSMGDVYMYVLIAAAIFSYLLGSLNFSIIISKLMGDDIRKHGSGNAGSTNMLRTYGKKIAVAAFAGDILKGIIAMAAARLIAAHVFDSAGKDFYFYLSEAVLGSAVVLGHNFPVFFKFKGGKGIATSEAVIFMYDWRVGLCVIAVFLITVIITKYVSLGSVFGAITVFAATLIFTVAVDSNVKSAAPIIILSAYLAVLAIWRHKGNIKKLINGTESKLGQKSK